MQLRWKQKSLQHPVFPSGHPPNEGRNLYIHFQASKISFDSPRKTDIYGSIRWFSRCQIKTYKTKTIDCTPFFYKKWTSKIQKIISPAPESSPVEKF